MLYQALSLVQSELNLYLQQLPQLMGLNVSANLHNVANIEQEPPDDESVMVSLVNIEEERALKNIRVASRNNLNGQITYEHTPVHLNLYILFSAFSANYDNALKYLSHVMEFFVSRPLFQVDNFQDTTIGSNLDDFTTNGIRLSFNMYSMTFEQQNHLWGSLGGKMLPAVMYRVTLVRIDELQSRGNGMPIEEINGQEINV